MSGVPLSGTMRQRNPGRHQANRGAPGAMGEAGQQRKDTLLHFGGFTLNLDRRGLYRGQERVRLTSKPLETLILLVEHRTRVVEKQTLLDVVWKGTFVTEDVLVQAVREIRRVLGDDKEDPLFIQTVPRQGYRFVGDVRTEAERVPEPPPLPAVTAAAAPPVLTPDDNDGAGPPALAPGSRRRVWLALAGLVVLIPAVWLARHADVRETLFGRSEAASPAAAASRPGRTTLMTVGKFSAGKAALSPDGKLLLFLSSAESTQERTADGHVKTYGDLFVRELATGNDVRITEKESPSGDIPVFTAEGTHVVFSNYRRTESGTSLPDLYRVLSGGGTTGRRGEPFITEASGAGFSPDGEWVAYTKHLPSRKALWVSPARRPEAAHREIASGGFTPRWSWDGTRIAYTTSNPNGGLGDLWVVDAASLTGHRNLTNEPQQMYGLTWTPDGQSLIFASKRTGPSLLWRVSAAGGPVEAVTELTGDFAAPSMSRSSGMLVFSHYRGAQNLMLAEGLQARESELSGDEYHMWPRLSPSGTYVASVMQQPELGEHLYVTDRQGNHTRLSDVPSYHPCWAGEGRLAYLRWDNDGRRTQVLEVNIDDPARPTTTPLHTFSGRAEWLAVDPQGRGRMAVVSTLPDGRQHIVLLDLAQGIEQTVASGAEYAKLRWSPDGSMLAWSGPDESGPGSNGIWLLRLGAGSEPRRIVVDGQGPVWGPDGSTIYFSKVGAKSGLWQVEVNSRKEELIREWDEVPFFDVVGHRLVFCQLGSTGKNRIYSTNMESRPSRR